MTRRPGMGVGGVKAGDKIDTTMATLPNHANAVINEQKLSGYALDSEHPVGGHKARKFKAALGFESAHVKEIAKGPQDASKF